MSNNKTDTINKLTDILKTNKKLFLIALLIIFILLATGATRLVIYNIEKRQAEELPDISYEIKKLNEATKEGEVVVTFASEIGIDTIKQKSAFFKNNPIEISDNVIHANGKMKVAVDYKMKDRSTYNYLVKYKNGQEKTLTIEFEINRRKGVYSKVNGLYVNEPDLIGFKELNTRYVYMNAQGIMVPGNWINGEKPSGWYDYKNANWANIYVESEGAGSYYTWIPRYCYKIDEENSTSGNERMDVKFINTYDEYIDPTTGDITEWDELMAQGYQIPEAFTWETIIMPGYWMSKYQLSELTSYKLDFASTASKTSITIRDISTNTTQTISKYEYAVDGNKVYESATVQDYKVENVGEGTHIVNVTAKDSNGQIVASMTKLAETARVNSPDLSGFDPYTTFYVYWDKNGIEHNEIPISKEPPEDWYDYGENIWANILTRVNGTESYFVWIPRYQYALNTTSQRSYVKFIEGTSTQTLSGYQIPEAFTWGDENSNKVQLSGYWMSKYQLGEKQSTLKVNAEMSEGSNSVRVGDISGTVVTNNSSNIKIEYYKDGQKMHEGTNVNENYTFTGLELKKTYGLTVIIRNKTTNAYLGGATQKVTTIAINPPDLSRI